MHLMYNTIMDKELIISTIKEWMDIDNDLKEIQKLAKEKRERKKYLTEMLVTIMRDNEIDCFDVNQGKLVYTKRTVKETMSKKYLLKALQAFYREDPEHANEVTDFLLNNRQEKIKEQITRK